MYFEDFGGIILSSIFTSIVMCLYFFVLLKTAFDSFIFIGILIPLGLLLSIGICGIHDECREFMRCIESRNR